MTCINKVNNEDEQPKQNYDTAIQSGQEIINKSQDPV